jgi:hypothetical protein
MKNKFQVITACVAAFASCAPVAASAATRNSPSPLPKVAPPSSPKPTSSPAAKTTPSAAPKATPHPAMVRAVPFHGMISAVDQKAKTFTIAGKEKSRTFKVTNRTILSKAGAAATMKDFVANEEVRGSYWKGADGTLEAKTIKLGPLTEAEKAAKEDKKKPAKSETSPNTSPSVSPSTAPAASPSAPPTTSPSTSPSASAKP